MDLTIVTIVLDDLPGLLRTRASVAAQDLGGSPWRVEHVIVDGGSADGCVEQARDWQAAGQIRLVEGPDAGIYDGMNRGLAASTGRYVWFVNSGDVLHGPGAVAGAMSRVSARAAEWYYGAVVPVDGEGRRTGPTLLPTLTARGLRWGDVYASHQGMLMSTDLLVRLGGFDAGYASAGEFHLYLRAIRLCEPVRIDAELVDFLVGGRSTTCLSEHLREMSRARTDVLRPALPGRVLNRGLTGYRTWRGTTGLRSLPGVHSLRQRYLVIRHGSPGP